MTDSRQGVPPNGDDPDRTSERTVRPPGKAEPAPGASDLLRSISHIGLDSPRSDIETREVSIDPSLMLRCAEAHEDVTEEILIDPALIEACRPDDPDGDPYDAPIPDVIQERLEAARTGQYVKLQPNDPALEAVEKMPPAVMATPTGGVPRAVEPRRGISVAVVLVIGLAMLVLGLGVGGVLVFVTFTSGSPSPVTATGPGVELTPRPLEPGLVPEVAPALPPEPDLAPALEPEDQAINALVPAPLPARSEPVADEARPAPPPPPSPVVELSELPERLALPVVYAPGSEEPTTVDTAGIRRIAALITEANGVRMELVGFSTASDEVTGVDAVLLRRRRAESARDLLRSHGPSRRRFSMRGARDDETFDGAPGGGEGRLVLLVPTR